MKKSLFTLGIALALSAGVFGQSRFFQTPQTEKEKEVEQLRMEAFRGGQMNTLPYVPAHRLSDWADKTDKMFPENNLKPLSSNPKLYNAVKEQKQKEGNISDLEIQATLTQSGWGTMTSAEDGKSMVYTIEPIPSDFVYYIQQYYKGIKFAYYDDTLGLIKEFEFYSNTDTTMSFQVVGSYSSRFFNTDNKLEFCIKAHSFANMQHLDGPITCRDTVYIVNEDGDVLGKMGNTSGVVLHQAKTGYTASNRVAVFQNNYTDISDTAVIDIYNAKELVGESPAPLHSFKIANNLSSYTEAPLFSIENIENETFYAVYRNEKPFVANGDQMNPVVEMDNKFKILLYNPDFSLAKDISLPLIGLEDNEWSIGSIIYFDEYRFSRHRFNSDDKIEIVYAMSRYVVSCDCNILDVYLMDEDGNIVKELIEDVGGLTRLQDLPGKNNEYAIWHDAGNGIESIIMYDIDAQEEITTFKATHNGDLISLYYERVPNINGECEYVFGLGRAEAAEETSYGILAYYDRNGKETKRVRIDIGNNAATFEPILNGSTLNPYTFVSDEKQEYLWFMKTYNPDGTVGGAFAMANENERLYTWGDLDDMSMSGAGILPNAEGTAVQNLYVSYMNQLTYERKTVFYKVPFDKVELQGEGTQESPYIITTPVELDMIRKEPDAYYELGNNIDMVSFTGVSGSGFVAIPDFSGHFDGKNHIIENIIIYGSNEAGLFASMQDGTVCNLMMRNVSFSNPAAGTFGAVVGRANGRIYNCHVETDIKMVLTSSYGNFGGIAGNISGNISQCSFEGKIDITNLNAIGGIAGQLNAGAEVVNCFSTGSIHTNAGDAGGIFGTSMMRAKIQNSHSSMDIQGIDYVGGIGGSSKGYVEKTYATGKIVSVENPSAQWKTNNAGGILGETQSSMMPGYVKKSFALNDTVASPINATRIAYTVSYSDYSGNVFMDSNYAASTMLLGSDLENLAPVAAGDTNTKINRMHGQSGTLDEFTQDFYVKNGWSFGNDSVQPWVMNGNMPRLWFEFQLRAVELPFKETSILKGQTVTLTPSFIPQDATNRNVRYKSSDVAVASVNAQGVVTGNNGGTATITVTSDEGGYTASCLVHVNIPVEQVIIEKESYEVAPYATVVIKASVLPENATNKNVLYRSLNQGVAMCYGSTVMGVAEGTTQIVAVSEDGNASDTCTVVVAVPVEDIILNETSITLSKEQPSFRLVATLYPEDATEVELQWSSADENVATVESNGLVSGHTKGNTTVTVSTPDGSVSSACYVNVTEDIESANEAQGSDKVDLFISNNVLHIEASRPIDHVSIWNAGGTKVHVSESIDASLVQIPVENWTKGIYMVRLGLDNGRILTTKIIR